MAENKPKTKVELLAEKMAAQNVAKKAFEAGAKPIIETDPPKEEATAEKVTEIVSEVTEPKEVVEKSTEQAQEPPKGEKKGKDTPKAKKAATAAQNAPKSLADKYEAELKAKEKDANKVKISVTISPDIKAELQKRADKNDTTVSKYLDGLLRGAFGL